jgi:hypothetical protein
MNEETRESWTTVDSVRKEVEAHEMFKALRNRLRKLRPEEVVRYCIQELNPGRSFELTEAMRRPPWHLLLLIKWITAHGEFLSPKRRSPTDRDAEEIFAMLKEIWGKDLPSCYENVYLFFRAQFQQQYWLQENFLIPEMSRQYILFLDLEPEHHFSVAFRREHGIELNSFLELILALISRFIGSPSYSIEERFFANLAPSYPPGTIPAFLSILSRDLESLNRELSTMPKHGILHEIIEPTPLLRFPLLKENNRYHCYLVHLLFRTVQNFVYDTLRAADTNAFTNKFGPIFERYLERGLSHAPLEYMTESELAKNLPQGSKLVDFAILSEDAAVLIEAKAIQLTGFGMLARTSATLAGKASTALKAIEQGFAVASNLRKVGLIEATCPLFLLVVTYKDLLLGSGREFYENAAKEPIDRFAAAYRDTHPIPLDHIFFLSINDFDLLMEYLRSSGVGLVEFLQKAVRDNTDSRTGSYVFRTHIPEVLSNPQYPEYLHAEFENSGKRLRALLPPPDGNR